MRIRCENIQVNALRDPKLKDESLRNQAIPQGGYSYVTVHRAASFGLTGNLLKNLCDLPQISLEAFGNPENLCKHTHTHTLATRVKIRN